MKSERVAFTQPPEPKLRTGRIGGSDRLDRLHRAMAKFRDPRVRR